MNLTQYELDMLAGRSGEGAAMAMRVLCDLGELFGATRFLPILRAHIDGCAYTCVWDAGIEFVEKLSACGARVTVPATLNATSRDIRNWEAFRIPAEIAQKNQRLEAAYLQMGCIPLWSCAPYDAIQAPRFGQHIAWAESNAVNYANSVLGARTERYGDLVDVCCAVAGRVPECGLHIKKNRAGSVLFLLDGVTERDLADPMDFAALGYLIGKETGNHIPVIDGWNRPVAAASLKALSAASAASGSVALFHMVGATPEAATREEAFQGNAPARIVTVTPAVLDGVRDELTCAQEGAIDLVVLGCPHATYTDLQQVHGMLNGRRVHAGVEFWIQTNCLTETLARRSGVAQALESLGVKLLTDGCINNFPVTAWGFRTIATNSGKMAHYAPGNTGAKVAFLSTQSCVEAAVKGAWAK